MEWMGMMMICSGKAVKRLRMLRVSVRNLKAPLTAKMETETLIGKGR
jgi:hypothetical protein